MVAQCIGTLDVIGHFEALGHICSSGDVEVVDEPKKKMAKLDGEGISINGGGKAVQRTNEGSLGIKGKRRANTCGLFGLGMHLIDLHSFMCALLSCPAPMQTPSPMNPKQ